MIEPILRMNKPFSVNRGHYGEIESNCINAYVGEFVVFRFELGDEYLGETIELRVPFEFAIDSGLVIAENEEEDLGDND